MSDSVLERSWKGSQSWLGCSLRDGIEVVMPKEEATGWDCISLQVSHTWLDTPKDKEDSSWGQRALDTGLREDQLWRSWGRGQTPVSGLWIPEVTHPKSWEWAHFPWGSKQPLTYWSLFLSTNLQAPGHIHWGVSSSTLLLWDWIVVLSLSWLT